MLKSVWCFILQTTVNKLTFMALHIIFYKTSNFSLDCFSQQAEYMRDVEEMNKGELNKYLRKFYMSAKK